MVALRVPGALALLAALSVQGLGAPDADVDDFDGFVDCADDGCIDNPVCTGQWTCASSWWGDGYCDCGCGTMDVDCPSDDAADCYYSNCANGHDPTYPWECNP